MGLFPYNCDKCRGGDFRCGTTYCQPCCKGGQTCWEEEMVMILTIQDKRIHLFGNYDGYGRIIVKGEIPKDVSWETIGLKLYDEKTIEINDFYRNTKIVGIYCKSCL